MTTPTSLPSPPRLLGNPVEDSRTLLNWTHQFYQVFANGRIIERIAALSDLETLNITISAAPTQSEVEQVRDKINAVINAAKGV